MKFEILKQKINYNQIVTGKQLDKATYKKKIEMCEFIFKHDLFKTNDENIINLMNDPTIFCYFSFRDNNGEPLKLTAYQDAIVNCTHDLTPNNPNRFILFKASNQIGKSIALACLAVFHVILEKNINVIMVSKSLPQSQFLLAQIRHLLNNSVFGDTWRESLGDTANTTVLTFVRDKEKVLNRIICAPCGEGLLGYPVHYLYLDEADYYENGKVFFWKVAFPRTNQTKGQIILFSNPNPDIARPNSILWELWNSDMFKRKFTFNFLDAPWNTRREYDEAKRSSPSYIFDSTHDGEFPIDSGGFFTRKEIDDMMQIDWKNQLPVVDKPVFIGLDLAKIHDRTVLTLGTLTPNKENPKISDLEVRYIQHFPTKTDYDIIVKKLSELVDYFKNQAGVAGIGLDVSGVGQAVSDFARTQKIKCFDVKFSLKNKSRLYANFKLLAEQRRIRVVYVKEAEEQFSNLVFSRTPQGYLSVHHLKENLKDDIPDSICALIDVSVMPSKIPVTVTFVEAQEATVEQRQASIDLREKVVAQAIRDNKNKRYGEFSELGGFGW